MTWPGLLTVSSRYLCFIPELFTHAYNLQYKNCRYDNFTDYVTYALIKRVIFSSAQQWSEVVHYESAQPDRRSVRLPDFALAKHNSHCITNGFIIRTFHTILPRINEWGWNVSSSYSTMEWTDLCGMSSEMKLKKLARWWRGVNNAVHL
jgi:hypothetical protein